MSGRRGEQARRPVDHPGERHHDDAPCGAERRRRYVAARVQPAPVVGAADHPPEQQHERGDCERTADGRRPSADTSMIELAASFEDAVGPDGAVCGRRSRTCCRSSAPRCPWRSRSTSSVGCVRRTRSSPTTSCSAVDRVGAFDGRRVGNRCVEPRAGRLGWRVARRWRHLVRRRRRRRSETDAVAERGTARRCRAS